MFQFPGLSKIRPECVDKLGCGSISKWEKHTYQIRPLKPGHGCCAALNRLSWLFFSSFTESLMIKSRGMRAGRSLEVCSVSDTAWDNGKALPPSKVSLYHFDTSLENRLIGKERDSSQCSSTDRLGNC